MFNLNTMEISQFNKARYTDAPYFAAIKASGECLTQVLCESLRAIHHCTLIPILVHGGGKQIDAALKEHGFETKKINGRRITDKQTLDVVVATLHNINRQFVSDINSVDYIAQGLTRIFYAKGMDPVYGYVSDVTGLDTQSINACLHERLIPVICSLGIDPQGHYYNINADSAFKYLVYTLKPMKVIFLTSTCGVLKEDELIHEMNHLELQDFINSRYVTGGMKLKLVEAAELLEHGFDVQITSPEHLLRNLFSSKGYGTYLKH